MASSRGRGRPKKQFPPELIDSIIYRYAKEKNISGKILYARVYKFSQELFANGEIEHEIGEFYWRKGDGRVAIDKANQALKHVTFDTVHEDGNHVDTISTINKFFTGKKADKEKLIGALKINEVKLKQYMKKYEQLEKKLIETQLALEKEKEKSQKYRDNAESYEEILFQWMELSVSKDIPLTNLYTTGKTRSPVVEQLMKDAFSENPTDALNSLNGFIKDNQKNKKKEKNGTKGGLIPINTNQKKERSILDDFDF